MTRLALAFAAVALCACDPNGPCKGLIGQPLPSANVLGSARFSPPELSGPPFTGRESISVGPAVEHYCCATGRLSTPADCPAVDCSLPENTDVTVYTLSTPYTYEYRRDEGQACQVSVKDGVVMSVWTHYYH